MVDILLRDNARPHTNSQITEEIAKIVCEVLPHRPYSPDLTPSHLHLLGPLKDVHRGIHSEDEEAVKTCVYQWLKKRDRTFYHIGVHALIKRWIEAVEMDRNYTEK
ncbi:hypothetical protein Trydic_g14579 [Trypoxylus dichotomus]